MPNIPVYLHNNIVTNSNPGAANIEEAWYAFRGQEGSHSVEPIYTTDVIPATRDPAEKFCLHEIIPDSNGNIHGTWSFYLRFSYLATLVGGELTAGPIASGNLVSLDIVLNSNGSASLKAVDNELATESMTNVASGGALSQNNLFNTQPFTQATDL